MKKVLAVFLALYLIVPASFAQDDEIRPAAIGISFILNDFQTAERIRSTSLSGVFANKQWSKIKEMSPGIAISYFKGLKKHIDFAGTLAGSFAKYKLPGRPNQTSGDKFLLEADASLNFKMVSEKYLVQPYVIAGLGIQMYGGTYWGAFFPTGLGLKLNIFDDAHFFVTSQYRLPVTKESVAHHFFNQFGIAGRITEKKEPVLKPLPPAPEPPADSDKDGILDSLDKCPTVPGLPKYDGCPVPDTDKDGINDEEDKCPSVAGLARYQGCPVPDTDKDGINDEEDKCPAVAGPASNQGCPFADTDGDGVIDEEDKCPTIPGTKENNGCPAIPGFDAKNVQFVTGSATLAKGAISELNDLAAYMSKFPEVKLEISGHTDNVGKALSNQKLSERRAASAKAYLVKKGVSADRITANGFGMDQPVAENNTPANRALNRRVEFKIAQ